MTRGRAFPRADSQSNRERILASASRLLEQSHAATLGEIAAAAGVSRSTLYRHFASRRELVDAVGSRPPTGRAAQPAEELLPPGQLGLMHRTLKQMPGPRAEMTAVAAHWDPVSHQLTVSNCGHVAPTIIRAGRQVERLRVTKGRGLGGRAAPRPSKQTFALGSGDRLVMVSDGVVSDEEGKAGLGFDGLAKAALGSEGGDAADTVRKIHAAVLASSGEELEDDATAVCLAVT